MGVFSCTSVNDYENRIRFNLERAAKKHGWSEKYTELMFQLLTCHNTDANQHAELLEALEAEYERMTRS